MRLLIASISIAATLAVSACSLPGLPRVHRITIQQGNVITQEMIDQLKPGMTRSQVAFIMGEPIYRNSFDDTRWDYIYTVDVPGYFEDERRVTLYFENDLLAYFTGDYAPTEARSAAADAAEDTPNDASSG